MVHNLNGPVQVRFNPLLARTGSPLIGPETLQMWELRGNAAQDERHGGAVLHIGGMHPRPQDEFASS
jgi:hypothetical protein